MANIRGTTNAADRNNSATDQHRNKHNTGICKILRIHGSAIRNRHDRPRASRTINKPLAHMRRQIYFHRPIRTRYEHLRTNNKPKKHDRQGQKNLWRILEGRNQKRLANRSIPLGTRQRRNSNAATDAEHDRQQRPGIDQIINAKKTRWKTNRRTAGKNTAAR